MEKKLCESKKNLRINLNYVFDNKDEFLEKV